MFGRRDIERARRMASTARNPRTCPQERVALLEWLAAVPLEERSQAIRTEVELDVARDVESSDARRDARALAEETRHHVIDLQVVTAPTVALATEQGKQREHHDPRETANRATATVSFVPTPELVVEHRRAAAQGGVDAEHRRSARLDHDELIFTPLWDGSCGWNRDKDGTPLTRKRAPSAFTGPERWAIRDARREGAVYRHTYDAAGVLLSTEIDGTS